MADTEIHIPLPVNLSGEAVYEKIMNTNIGHFLDLNIHVLPASPNPPLSTTLLNAPLVELLYRADAPLHTALRLPSPMRSNPASKEEYDAELQRQREEQEDERRSRYDDQHTSWTTINP